MSGLRSRRKGAGYERLIARRLAEKTPAGKVSRGYQYRGGDECPDVDVAGVLWIECKRHKMPNIRAAMRQAIADAPKGRIPVAVTRADRCDVGDIVSLTLADFEELWAVYWQSVNR